MRHVITSIFVMAGIVNLLPVVGVLGATRLETLYELQFAGADLILLLRHRAVLFSLLGAFLIVAAFRPVFRSAATTAGLISMLSFAFLALPLASHNTAIQRVFWIDVVASALLAAAWLLAETRRA